jgi:phytoene dehydrogenase-like protein
VKKKIIIIGAGIAGLAAGCYAQINGYEAEIVEMQSHSGGLCMAWKRKEYIFDGCIHFLMGTNPQSWLHGFWDAVGAFDETEIYNHSVYMQMEGTSGQELKLFCDLDELRSHMVSISQEDAGLISELVDAIRNFSLAGSGSRLGSIGMQKFSQEFKNLFLRDSLSIFKDIQFFLSTMSAYSRNDAGWPVGGSLALIRGMENRFIKLGGQIHFNSKADEIIIDCNRATGVKLINGSLLHADYVISAADGHSTIYHMLGGKYTDEQFNTLYTNGRTYPTSIQVSLGIDEDLSSQPYYLHLGLQTPLEIAGEQRNSILLKNYSFDRTICPAGKSVITILISSNYVYWRKVSENDAEYKREKERIASAVAIVLEQRFPMIKGKIDVIDIATPLTYQRYTDAWNGAYMGWMSTPEMPIAKIPSTLPGLSGFVMAGQWTYPRGGLPTALMTARGSIMKICSEDGRTFIDRADG